MLPSLRLKAKVKPTLFTSHVIRPRTAAQMTCWCTSSLASAVACFSLLLWLGYFPGFMFVAATEIGFLGQRRRLAPVDRFEFEAKVTVRRCLRFMIWSSMAWSPMVTEDSRIVPFLIPRFSKRNMVSLLTLLTVQPTTHPDALCESTDKEFFLAVDWKWVNWKMTRSLSSCWNRRGIFWVSECWIIHQTSKLLYDSIQDVQLERDIL